MYYVINRKFNSLSLSLSESFHLIELVKPDTERKMIIYVGVNEQEIERESALYNNF